MEEEVKRSVQFLNRKLESLKFPKDFRYADLTLLCIDAPPKQGLRISQMVERISLYNKIKNEKDNERILFDKKELDVLYPLVEQMEWTIISEELVNFLNHLKYLKEEVSK